MSIGIGINENVYISKAEVDDKGTLSIGFEEAGAAKGTKVANPFDNIALDGEVSEKSFDMTVKLFPPLPPKEGNDRTEEKNVELLVGDINKTKGIILHLLKGYMTADQLKGLINPFRGLPIDKDNFNQQVQKKEILEGIHRNMCTDFTAAIKPFVGKTDRLFRLLLVRQSKDKHFATFRGRFLEDNPFWESMDVPAEASKVKFTKYELDNGFDSAAPVKKDQAADQNSGSTGEAPLSAASVFGS